MSSDSPPVLVAVTLIFFCLVAPILCIKYNPVFEEPISLRERVIVMTSFLAGLPLAAGTVWDRVGLPPSGGALRVFLLFLVYLAAVLLQLAFAAYVTKADAWKVRLAAVAMPVALFAGSLIAPAITLWDVYSEAARKQMQTISYGPCPDAGTEVLAAHISDLHISHEPTTRDGARPGNEILPALLSRIVSHRPHFLLISGDITDKGEAAQWRIVEDALLTLSPSIRVVIAPGNHDLNHFFGDDPLEHESVFFSKTAFDPEDVPRVFRVARAQAKHLPEVRDARGRLLRDYVSTTPTAPTIKSFPREIAECTSSCIANAPLDPKLRGVPALCRAQCMSDLESIRYHYFRGTAKAYPLSYVDSNTQTAFLILSTSIHESSEPGRNAVGKSGSEQIEHVASMLADFPQTIRRVILVQHHPVLWSGVPDLPSLSLTDIAHPIQAWQKVYSSPWFVSVFLRHDFQEGDHLFALLRDELRKRPEVTALVTFGHRHVKSLARDSDARIFFVEAPNVATEEPADAGFVAIYEVGKEVRVGWCPA